MEKHVVIIGAGLAGSECALQLARRGIPVSLHEMRPDRSTGVHRTSDCAELVCSNSLKGTRPDSAAGMLKHELDRLGSVLYATAREHSVAAGGALAVDRNAFSQSVTRLVEDEPLVELVRGEVTRLDDLLGDAQALVLATGPLTSDALADEIARLVGCDYLAFYDAAAPIVMADSINAGIVFRQNRYGNDEDGQSGDYLNAPMDKAEYERFVDELLAADRVISKDFETKELFQACQPIEEIARAGRDAPRFGPMKPIGLTDPRSGKRPWAAVQLRAEDELGTSYNLVGFQTNLRFPEQARVFRMIPGLENAEFARYGVMHRNTFLDAPRLLDSNMELLEGHPRSSCGCPAIHVAGQLSGTEGYCEAMRSGLHVALAIAARCKGLEPVAVPRETAFGALVHHATSPETQTYQPMHVNFGIMTPLDEPIRNKRLRYAAYAQRADEALERYTARLAALGLLDG